MNSAHIPFQRMSDLFDEDICAEDEREAIRAHFNECTDCSTDYERLERTLRMVKECACSCCPPEALPMQIIRKIRLRRRRNLLLKSIPAMAASVLIIAGVGYFNTGVVPPSRQSIAIDSNIIGLLSDTEHVIDIIRKHNAAISDVTDKYIEGTASLASFESLRRDLGFHKVAYVLVEESNQGVRDWGSAVEEVGADDVSYWNQGVPDTSVSKRYIRFRIYK
jgi:hypothetical protein